MTATLEREALVLHGYAPSILDRIRDKAVELAIWERELPQAFAEWLDALPSENLPDARAIADDNGVVATIAAMLDGARTPQGAMRDMLLDDIAGLARRFMAIMDSAQVDIRLEAVDHDACWKFHRDCVEARLLATYRGPGTQWVPPAFGKAALDRQKDYRGPIPSLSRFAAGMFKGSCAAPASGIVHRSPPIDGAGVTRLVLCLNLPRPVHH
ncbi:MAG: DUF1826 domain-containing protein [Alphaproteobacteria bacterium]|nr:DUF1826 domain-containing protein [Alphaproteobacteria bacterium]